MADVQRYYMVMKPEKQPRLRVAVLGRKRLPEARNHERIWGFIEAIETGLDVEEEFRTHRCATRTRGERTLPPVRPACEGIYALIRRDRNLHLTYELELPERPGEVQEELNIEREAAYILSIKNPDAGSPPGAGLPEREEARYPKPLEKEFRGRRFASEDPHLFDYEGAEFILIGARADPERAYAVDIETEHETARSAYIFRQLKMAPREHPIGPLIRGEWR
ncbi:hypothetical protein [Bradyrhizobium sp. ISRA463]|uniref:hypothetical protein n=1 Tax=Bradyrhizobium sp. ISRA463 TaxID=2866199 RepID=UPI00247AC97E|nr:hypothetical protein [Bradyrhizobium sp. ISRA463]WGS20347.1 hypothetical protein MTX22_00405 [Bradyrhizobium sp. ISRA463]